MDDLTSAWKGMNTTSAPKEQLQAMLLERKHPVLKRMRRQLLFEAIAFTALLFVYYDFFDGDKKPLYLNILLVAAVLFAIGHSVAGYVLSRRKLSGANLMDSLQHSLSGLRTTAIVSVASRAATAACLLLFLTAQINFTMQKYWMLMGIIAVFLVQGWLLITMWRKRIRQLQASIQLLK